MDENEIFRTLFWFSSYYLLSTNTLFSETYNPICFLHQFVQLLFFSCSFCATPCRVHNTRVSFSLYRHQGTCLAKHFRLAPLSENASSCTIQCYMNKNRVTHIFLRQFNMVFHCDQNNTKPPLFECMQAKNIIIMYIIRGDAVVHLSLNIISSFYSIYLMLICAWQE